MPARLRSIDSFGRSCDVCEFAAQKILPGNCTEVTLRALTDIWDGTDLCIVKPLENYQLTSDIVDRKAVSFPAESAFC